jgi:hypothetical protein
MACERKLELFVDAEFKRVEVFLGGSAKEPYSSQEGLEEVLGLGGQSGQHQRSQRQEAPGGPAMEKPALPTGRAERSAIESLVFTLKEDFEFAEMARRTLNKDGRKHVWNKIPETLNPGCICNG